MKILFLLITAIICSSSCDKPPVDHVYSIWFHNNSDIPINFIVSYDYPDTAIPEDYIRVKSIDPREKTPLDSKEKWHQLFSDLKKDTLSVFFISRNTLNNYEWENIRESYFILKRYDMSLEDLRNLNWNVYYPPTEEMSGIKIWPGKYQE